MSDRPHRGRTRLWSGGRVSVAVVLTLATALFVISAREARDPNTRHAVDLPQLLREQEQRVEDLTAQVADLGAEVQRLTGESDEDAGTSLRAAPMGYAVESGSRPVTGPGLVVRLDDAPPDQAPAGVRPDELVVHQQDIQAVMNALWAGGAESMTLMDQRIASTSAVRCVGNVLRLHGRVYSPPYVIRAVGDPQALRDALDASAAVRSYVRAADWVGLGWEVSESDEIEMPAYTAPELEHAQVPAGVDPLPGPGDDDPETAGASR